MSQVKDNSEQAAPDYNGLEIAIIGMSGRFPGAATVDGFWQNLRNGVESISFFSDEELMADGTPAEYLKNPKFVRAKGVLENIEWFDAAYFGYTPREAQIMDPQQRIFLECAVEALENAGYHSDAPSGVIGVYAGAGMNTYLLKNLCHNPDLMESVGEFETMIGNDKDFLTTRVSYKLNLEGPSVAVQTACSTSLVAVCMACRSLLSGDCDMVLAGGVSIHLPRKGGYVYQEGGILSPDGHCRAFDARAQGTPFSSAAGIVVLKRIEDALRDRDPIHAVIRGSALNNDGSFKIGFTAPRVDGQAVAIKSAQLMAEIPPATIDYLEAHGTGTPLGDPIELAALRQAFEAETTHKGYCAIGSVKTNIGHADAAAGIAGLIKTVLMLKHREIPPSLHFETPNPKLDIENSPFYVNRVLKPWPANGHPRRAGVSSFGIGGTNAHVLLEEAPRPEPAQPSRPWQLLLLSAKSAPVLEAMTENLAAHLKRHPDIPMDDVAYTLQVGRKGLPFRRMLVCRGREDAIDALENAAQNRWVDAFQEPVKRKPVFMFSGQGAQYVAMGEALYRHAPVFREQVDHCARILAPLLGWDLRTVLYPEAENRETASQQLTQTSITQVALFVVEYCLARLWMAWGVRPIAMVGHSIGEYVAACLAGVFSLADALSIVAARGRLMQQRPKGAMLVAALSEQEAGAYLGEDICLAAVNGPSLCVLSGETEAIDRLTQRFGEKRIYCQLLHTSHAFHSHMMTPMLAEFTRKIEQVRRNVPNIPFVSNVTGTWITPEEATDPHYWARHLRRTVRFADAMRELGKDANRIFLEVGPGNTLCTFARQYLGKSATQPVVSSLRHPKEQKSDLAVMLEAVGRLWLAGIQPDWSALYGQRKRSRIPLPPYPFERKRFWVEPRHVNRTKNDREAPMKRAADPARWLYTPAWEKVEKGRTASADPEKAPSRWLLFMDREGLGKELLQLLKKQGKEATAVVIGDRYRQTGAHEFEINPNRREDYLELVRHLESRNAFPRALLHLWCLSARHQEGGAAYFEKMQPVGYQSLLYVCQALGAQRITGPLSVQVIANGVSKVLETDTIIPEKATILGPCKVIPQEYPNITCRLLDVSLDGDAPSSMAALAGHLFPEITAPSPDPLVAYRDGARWLPKFKPLFPPAAPAMRRDRPPERIQQHGVYLITGGLGNVGMVMADYLASTVQARLILTARSAFPDPDAWEKWITAHDENDRISRKIKRLMALREKGAEVLVIKADVSNETQMRAALEKAERHFGNLNGLIHAAGIVNAEGFRFIQNMDARDGEEHFLSKAHGLYVLQKLLKGKQLDLCQAVSSVASILGGLGYSAYAAANSFMDAFVHRHRSQSTPWMSVNWDAWRFDEKRQKGVGASLVALGISPEEGRTVLQLMMSQEDQAQLVVSTTDLQYRIEQWIELEATRESWGAADGTASSTPAGLTAKAETQGDMDAVAQRITAIWQELLGIEAIGRHDDFFELGGSSLTALRLFAEIERVFGKKISLATLLKDSTVAKLAEIVRQDDTSSSWNSLVSFQDNNSRPPIFLIHGAEGNILLYRELAQHLGAHQPVYGLQSQGLDGTALKDTRIEDIAAHYIRQIQTRQPQGPYYLGGYCMGGVVAYEMSQQLFAQGQQVNLLAMFETYNPQLDISPTSLFQRGYYTLQNLSFHLQNFMKLGTTDKFRFFGKKAMVALGRMTAKVRLGRFLSRKNGQGPSVSSIKKMNDNAYYHYKPQAFPGRVTLFRPEKFFSGADDPYFGWNKLAKGGLAVFKLPVNPRGMLVEPFVRTLAEKLTCCIQTARDNEESLKN